MSDDTQQPIIVKRIKKGGGGAHGGAWKIAYADFVTAMMAFFLLMWLLGSTAQGDLEGIADHFQNPLKLAMAGGEGSGDSSSIIKGGGEDLSRKVGQVRRGDTPSTRAINVDAARDRHPAELADEDIAEIEQRRERARLIDLKGRIEAIIEADATLRQFKNQILMDITTEGLRIQLVDEQNRPMFDSSSAELRPYTRDLLRSIGRALNDVDNRISLSGHTDASRYAGGDRGFSNWELSSNRANASRRELVAGGLAVAKVVRVVGLADTTHLNKDNPLDPINRRISIIVLNKRTEESIRGEGGNAGADPAVGGGPAPAVPGVGGLQRPNIVPPLR
ncbi:flagellar motor protein MotB [Parazoarcus communis]|uniref:Motility protein MotB n=1 Tax=Parazoarcus communis SWub3 = DSM 12120 TaxID=1121029 RepID=A0A323UU21_9RHOO|nr:flagellar motor protein MotB [Parazoarcus communis]NMG70583.1 flagellar motor protein MotB [Parazoarcus communis SWub3 = DSM 12120]PZA15761.1 motility protein MotB [Azoarcus communis] [Parazoarcus communis SWub3 = DSM 12120]